MTVELCACARAMDPNRGAAERHYCNPERFAPNSTIPPRLGVTVDQPADRLISPCRLHALVMCQVAFDTFKNRVQTAGDGL
jgi:hypothetical protein